jgi:hypothetical protein
MKHKYPFSTLWDTTEILNTSATLLPAPQSHKDRHLRPRAAQSGCINQHTANNLTLLAATPLGSHVNAPNTFCGFFILNVIATVPDFI